VLFIVELEAFNSASVAYVSPKAATVAALVAISVANQELNVEYPVVPVMST